MDNNLNSNFDNTLSAQQNYLPESPETPPFGPPGSSETPPFGPPGNFPISPETPPFGPPGNFPISPETPPFSPPIERPQPPTIPNRPGNGSSAIRILYAATNEPPVNITIGRKRVASNFQYSNVTEYTSVPAGYVEITVRNARNNSTILSQTSFLLENGGIYTAALINAPNGLVLYLIEDTACFKNFNDSCFRIVNLAYRSPAIDYLLGNGQLLFRNVRYMDITEYRQIRPGSYPLLAVESKNCGFQLYDTNRAIQVVPIVIGANITSCYGQILLSSLIRFNRNGIYTVYMIGNAFGRPQLQFQILENYLEY